MFVSSITIIHRAGAPFQEPGGDCDTIPDMMPLIVLLLVFSVISCSLQTPVRIYVTPTQIAQSEAQDLVPTMPTVAAVAVASLTSLPLPSETPVAAATFTPEASPTPAVPVASSTPEPSPTPIIPPTTPLPYLKPDDMGVQLHTLLSQDDFGQVARLTEQLGLGWVKVQIDWKLLQPNGAGDTGVDFRRQELYLEDLKRRGHKVLVSVARAPDWARSNREAAGPPDDPQLLAAFMDLMLEEFGKAIDAVEVWNEPNLLREWTGRPISGAEYMRYFRAARDAVNNYSQRMQFDVDEPRSTPVIVLTAGLAPTGNSPWSVDDRAYLRQMYNAGLARLDNVQIGAHPFGWGNPPELRCCNAVANQGWDDAPQFFFLETLDTYRDIMLAFGDAEARIWVTEFGWPTWDSLPGEPPEPFVGYNNKWAQADYTLRAFQIGEQLDYVGPMILWNMNFAWLPPLVSNRDERAAYSLLVPLQPQERPLYWMIYDAVRPELQLDSYD